MVVKEGLVAPPLSLPRESVASPEDYALCRRIMQRASQNYSFASCFLPRDKRRHVEALYALMRVGDDRVDVSHSGFPSPLAAIEDWERTYWSAFEVGSSPDPVIRAYLDTALTFQIPPETMAAYFRAMKEDLVVCRFPTFADLWHYMEGSAIPVGRAMTYILGTRAPYQVQHALPAADSLAVAMQLSNFWRDVWQDWDQMGRIYIPLEDMERFGYTPEDLAQRRVNRAWRELLEFEISRTEDYYRQARPGVAMLASGRWGVMTGLEVYRAILPAIRRNGYDVFRHRAGASQMQKMLLVMKAGWQVLFSRPLPLSHAL